MLDSTIKFLQSGEPARWAVYYTTTEAIEINVDDGGTAGMRVTSDVNGELLWIFYFNAK